MQSVKVKIIIVSNLLNPHLAFHFDIFNFQSAIYNCWLQNLTQILRSCLMKEARPALKCGRSWLLREPKKASPIRARALTEEILLICEFLE